MRSIAAPKSACAPSASASPISFCARRASATMREARITLFEGTQPTFRQSPPSRWRSTSATFAPSPAAIAEVISPAVPAPITTRL